jgi:uncharacterized membrane protein YgcG
MCCRIGRVYIAWDSAKKEGIFWGDRVITPEQGEALESDRGEMIDPPRLPTALGHCCVVPALTEATIRAANPWAMEEPDLAAELAEAQAAAAAGAGGDGGGARGGGGGGGGGGAV